MIFSNIFLSILHNIGLYIYIVKYKSGIKILGFLQNILKKIKKHFQKEKKYFAAYGQILKFFHAYFHIKKIASFLCLKNPKMDIITSL